MAWMGPVCAFVILMQQSQLFSQQGPDNSVLSKIIFLLDGKVNIQNFVLIKCIYQDTCLKEIWAMTPENLFSGFLTN